MFSFLQYLVCSNGAAILTFDTLNASTAVPNGYNNINWTNAYVYTNPTNTSGYYTGIVSRPNAINNKNGNPMTMTSANGSLITLNFLTVAAAWQDDLQLTVIGYRSDAVIVNNTYTLQVFTVSYLTFTGYTGLDNITFITSGGTENPVVSGGGMQFAMDNICLSFI
jgi:hypothetical protein